MQNERHFRFRFAQIAVRIYTKTIDNAFVVVLL